MSVRFVEISHRGLGVTAMVPERAVAAFEMAGWNDTADPVVTLEEFTIAELRSAATAYGIEIPKSVRRRGDISAFLTDALEHERSESS